MPAFAIRSRSITAAMGASLALLVASVIAPVAGASARVFVAKQILLGSSVDHTFTPLGSTTTKTEAISNPDDISRLGSALFVGFQNGVGPQGQASPSGDLDSTVVEFTTSGKVLGHWDLRGKTDGVTADPAIDGVIATANEDAHTSLYTIIPSAADPVTHYAYSESLPHHGGTDAISIYGGRIFISASAPGTAGAKAPQPTYPAVYEVTLDPSTKVATVTPLFFDEASATLANVGASQGTSVKLALTDPDSNEVVPADAPRFAGDFMLTSQGDEEQIFVSGAATAHQSLSLLRLTGSVDDTAWATSATGPLYSTDSTNDAVDEITGPFTVGEVIVAVTPCGENSAPATCPAPHYPANYLANLNPSTGALTAVTVHGAPYVPQGGLNFWPTES